MAARGWSVRGSRRSGPTEVRGNIEYRASGDIGGSPDWTPLLEGVSVVVHAAGRAHAAASEGDHALAEHRRINVGATEKLARAAAAAGAGRFIHISSLLVQALDTEKSGPSAGARPYVVSKREAEAALARIAADSPMEVVVFRPPLVYGPGVGANFRSLMRAVERGLPLPLASIRNRRSFIFVGNLADAVATAAGFPGPLAGIFPVSDGGALATPELLRRVSSAMGRPARLLPCPTAALRAAAMALGQREKAESLLGTLVADDRSFRDATGWSPPFTMAEGLAATVRGTPPIA